MALASDSATADSPLFELKAAGFTLPTLRVGGPDIAALEQFLVEQTARAPEFFKGTPVVIDLAPVKDLEAEIDFASMVGYLRGFDMVPVGIRGGTERHAHQARLMELAVLPEARAARGPGRTPVEPPPAEPNPAAEEQTAAKQAAADASETRPVQTRPDDLSPVRSKRIDTPVRSGQRVYARGADLILLAPVSSGAEVMADGNVHAYAAIRGRVLAGVRGDESARIYCRDLNPDLVSIAGRYKVNEDIKPKFAGRSVQVSLDGDALVFQYL